MILLLSDNETKDFNVYMKSPPVNPAFILHDTSFVSISLKENNFFLNSAS